MIDQYSRVKAGVAGKHARPALIRDNLSAEALARRQYVKPVTDIASLYAPGRPEDWEGFDNALERWRNEYHIRAEVKV